MRVHVAVPDLRPSVCVRQGRRVRVQVCQGRRAVRGGQKGAGEEQEEEEEEEEGHQGSLRRRTGKPIMCIAYCTWTDKTCQI